MLPSLRQTARPEKTNRDQGEGQECSEHVKRLIEEFDRQETKKFLRWLQGWMGDEAEDILQQGFLQFLPWSKKKLKPDATVADVSRALWMICRNLVYERHCHDEIFALLSWEFNSNDCDGNEVTGERVYIERFEWYICQKLHNRDVMKAVLRHFLENQPPDTGTSKHL